MIPSMFSLPKYYFSSNMETTTIPIEKQSQKPFLMKIIHGCVEYLLNQRQHFAASEIESVWN